MQLLKVLDIFDMTKLNLYFYTFYLVCKIGFSQNSELCTQKIKRIFSGVLHSINWSRGQGKTFSR